MFNLINVLQLHIKIPCIQNNVPQVRHRTNLMDSRRDILPLYPATDKVTLIDYNNIVDIEAHHTQINHTLNIRVYNKILLSFVLAIKLKTEAIITVSTRKRESDEKDVRIRIRCRNIFKFKIRLH